MKKQSNRWHIIRSNVIVMLLIVLISGMLMLNFTHDDPLINGMRDDLDTGWRVSDVGTACTLSDLPSGVVTVKRNIYDLDTKDRSLCMKSSDTFIEVSFDGIPAYQYAPQFPAIFGRSYGLYVHCIPIPDNTKTITMTLEPVYAGDTADVRSVCVQQSSMFLLQLFRQGFPALLICLAMISYGLLMLLLGVSNWKINAGQTAGFFSIGAMAILIGFWSANDTYLLQTLTGHPEAIKILCYLCMMFIAYAPVSFLASVTNRKDSRLLLLLSVLITVNFVLTTILALFRICDPHYMLLFSHCNIGIAMLITIIMMVQASQKSKMRKSLLVAIKLGMTAALIGVSADLLRFWLIKNTEYGVSPFTRVGVLIFMAAEGIYLLKEQNMLIIERGRAETMEKMAYTDALTGLANRAAFHKKEFELRQATKPCTIVQLDINFLKTVNDEFGHAEGDRHIIAAANAIRESLSETGICFRIGGDEFSAILDTEDLKLTDRLLADLERRTDVYNQTEHPPVPLRIAYGCAVFLPSTMTLEVAENMADQRMYEHKKLMKSIAGKKE